jgi:hypothetical protein
MLTQAVAASKALAMMRAAKNARNPRMQAARQLLEA